MMTVTIPATIMIMIIVLGSRSPPVGVVVGNGLSTVKFPSEISSTVNSPSVATTRM
ncbi:MAG: hypothetical protein ACFFEV_03680 [Candidatus Thorarchaeota archaeon]